jgi:ketosteroid isomerase-like protein
MWMRSLICSLFALCFFLSNAQTSADKKAIEGLMQAQQDCWNKADLEGFMKGYWNNDSLMFIGKSGITYGWQSTLNNYKKGYPDTASMGKLQFTLLELAPLSKHYFHVTGKWYLARTKGDLQGYFTLVFKKINGNWLIIKDHSS